MMVVLGVDAHKRTHTVVAVDPGGAVLGSVTVPATSQGHLKALQWAGQWQTRKWGVEDSRVLTRRLESDLLTAGERIVRVPPKMMDGYRRSARTRGKSDPIDALAVARAVLYEPDLPEAVLDGPSRELKLLVDYRESLVRERGRVQNSLRWRLHELDPESQPPAGSLDRYKVLDQTEDHLAVHTGLVGDLARRELIRIRELTREINQLEKQISRQVTETAPTLLTIPGCAALTAAKLVAEAADITRFKSKDAYAMFSGTAPIPAWSGSPSFRLNTGGNRQTNAAIHRIAITQIRCHPPAQEFIARRRAAGDNKRKAIRALKRRLADIIYRTLIQDAHTNQTQQVQAA